MVTLFDEDTRKTLHEAVGRLDEGVLSSAERYLLDAHRQVKALQKSLEEAMEGVSNHIHRFGGSPALKSTFQSTVRMYKPIMADGAGALDRLATQVRKEIDKDKRGGPEART